jgi:excisionase family DNA binding protein
VSSQRLLPCFVPSDARGERGVDTCTAGKVSACCSTGRLEECNAFDDSGRDVEREESGTSLAQATRALPHVLTVDELAALLRLERKAAYAAIRRGEIPGVQRIGRTIRISSHVLMKWLSEGQGRVPRRRSV